MPKRFALFLAIGVLSLAPPLVWAQADETTLTNWVTLYKATDSTQRVATFSNAGLYEGALKGALKEVLVQQGLMHAAEENRIDKNSAAPASSGGGTSAVSKGSVPWLFAFAVEHGALTESVDQNLITLRGNVANIIKALSVKDYVASYELGQDNSFVRAVSAASFAISLPSTQGNATPTFNTNSISSASAHLDLYNHRDPRDRRWRSGWTTLAKGALTALAGAQGQFTSLIQTKHTAEFTAWSNSSQATLNSLSASATDQEIHDALNDIANNFVNAFGGFDDVRQLAKLFFSALSEYSSQKNAVTSKIDHSPVLSFEYTFTNQSTVSLPSSSTQNLSVQQTAPNLSNLNLIFAGYLVAGSQFTLNASTDLFNSTITGTKTGTVRDYRASGQVDVPLPNIPNIGTSSLSFSGVFLSLLEEPLGQEVLVNSVPVTLRGNIGLFQAQWTIPIKGSGVRIPISFTASNRTELIKEQDKRGSIGVTFDLDSLFSKP